MTATTTEVPLSEQERRQEQCGPRVRLCDCSGCRRRLVSEADARRLRRSPEAVRLLFPRETPARRLGDGRFLCRTCTRPASPHPAPKMKSGIRTGPG